MIAIAEWTVWILLLLATLTLSWRHYDRAVRRGLHFHKATPKILFLGWVLVLVFSLTSFSKLHILWILPISMFIVVNYIIQKAIRESGKKFSDLDK